MTNAEIIDACLITDLPDHQSAARLGDVAVRSPNYLRYWKRLGARKKRISHEQRVEKIQRMQQSDIDIVCDHIIANGDNSQIGKVRKGILERFSKHLEEARDGRAPATV